MKFRVETQPESALSSSSQAKHGVRRIWQKYTTGRFADALNADAARRRHVPDFGGAGVVIEEANVSTEKKKKIEGNAQGHGTRWSYHLFPSTFLCLDSSARVSTKGERTHSNGGTPLKLDNIAVLIPNGLENILASDDS